MSPCYLIHITICEARGSKEPTMSSSTDANPAPEAYNRAILFNDWNRSEAKPFFMATEADATKMMADTLGFKTYMRIKTGKIHVL